MKYNKLTRRHFLQGSGSAFLSLPFLPSLMSKAEAATLPPSKFMVMFWTGHGGVNVQNMYPIATNPAVASQLHLQSLYASQNHNIGTGRLTAMKTTRASNLPYLATVLDGGAAGLVGSETIQDRYGLGPDRADLDGGNARLTPVIGNFVSDAMLNKMNLISGLDMMYYSGHGRQQMGNYCDYAGNTPTSPVTNGMANIWVPTIDAVMAAYSGFYAGKAPLAPSVVLNSYYGAADGFGTSVSMYPSSSGVVANANAPFNLGATFSLLFGGLGGSGDTTLTNKKTFILNNVHADYVRLARGAYGPGRLIGKDDRNRLEEFMSSLSSIISGLLGVPGSCSAPAVSATDTRGISQASGDYATTQTAFGLYNQMITAAFTCGLTQSFMVGMPGLIDQFFPSGATTPTFTDGVTGPDSHQALFHQHPLANRQAYMLKAQRYFFQYGFYDLMKKLDAVPGAQGGTMLDQSMLFWTQEAGFNTHNGNCLPMIMAGSAGGYLKTGNYVDYRNANLPIGSFGSTVGHAGIPYNRFLGTALQAMGLPPSAFEQRASIFSGTNGRIPVSSRGTVPGYGHTYQEKMSVTDRNAYPYDYQLNDLSVALPIVT